LKFRPIHICVPEAAVNPHLAAFHALADDPLGAIDRLDMAGKNPLGYFSAYFPVELAMAFGYTPVRLTGFNREISHADASLQAYCCSLVRTALEAGMAGDLVALKGVAFTHACDTLQRLVEIWRHHKIHDFVPVLNFPADVSSDAAYEYFAMEMRLLADKFATHSGVAYDPERLTAAIRATNRVRAGVAKIIDLRAKGVVSFADSIAVVRAATLSDRAEFADRLDDALAAIGDLQGKPAKGPKLVFWGGVFETREVAEIIENAGARVVADVLTNMSHSFLGHLAVMGDPLETLARFYFERPVDATKYRQGEDRAERLLKTVRSSGADAVVFAELKFCEPFAFDYPFLKKRLDEHGIKSFFFEFDLWESGSGQSATRLEAFIEMLNA